MHAEPAQVWELNGSCLPGVTALAVLYTTGALVRVRVLRGASPMRGRTLAVVSLLVTGSGTWVACGGASGSDVLGAPGADDAGAGADGTATILPDGGPPVATGSDSGTSDAAPPRGGDGGTLADAGPGGTTTSLACGATSCAIPAETCCVARTGGGAASYSCVTGFTCAAAGGPTATALRCSGAANCPANQVCCVSAFNNGAASECQAACTSRQAQLCDVNAGATGCPPADPCSSANIGDWRLPLTYATCGGKSH
jgi:hypothetical protein